MQGCFGGGVFWAHTTRSANVSLNTSASSSTADTVASLEKFYGKPTSIKVTPGSGTNQNEIWTYKHGLVWDGAALAIVVPIPIGVPFGRDCTRYFIQDGRVVRTEYTAKHGVGGIYGYFAGPCNFGFGFQPISDSN